MKEADVAYRWEIMAELAARRLLIVIRARSPELAAELADSALQADLGVVEVALTTPGAIGVIEQLHRSYPDRLIGAGTVLDAASARLALLAGASLLVSPSWVPEVSQMAHRYGAAVIPGCATATEMLEALAAGADAVKIFPARTWSPRALSDLRDALPQLPCVPTGGISAADTRAWLDAGAIAVGMGSSLTSGGPGELAGRLRAIGATLAG
jgi:2-dehydro-3-deoxyphosphogluconate aldolase/(4S)-4-hydroxy-2-oxoglutarate aldolase